jgi:preprotein translocase subunit Sec63
MVGWGVFALLSFKITNTHSENKYMNPLRFLALVMVLRRKKIQFQYKTPLLKFHLDKVKLPINQTLEEANEYFVQLTKAYENLTDLEINPIDAMVSLGGEGPMQSMADTFHSFFHVSERSLKVVSQ